MEKAIDGTDGATRVARKKMKLLQIEHKQYQRETLFELLRNITKLGEDSRLMRGEKLPCILAKGVDLA